MNKSIRKARAAKAKPGTVAADHRIEIRDLPVNATVCEPAERRAPVTARTIRLAENEFAHLPVHVVLPRVARHAEVWRSDDGSWWRRGGNVRIQRWPLPDGPRAFVVFLYKGANQDDLEFLLKYVERARSGKGFDAEWRPVDADWSDDLTFALEYPSAAYVDPYTHEDPSPHVSVCDEPLCVRKWHTQYGAHELDEIRKVIPSKQGSYRISVQKQLDDYEQRGWTVDVYTDEFYGSPADVGAFVSDLQWMQAEAQRANGVVENVEAA